MTPLGNEVEPFWANVLAGKSGIARITHFDAKTFKTNFAAEVKNFDLAEYLDDRSDLEYAPSNCQFAVAAVNWRRNPHRLCEKATRRSVGLPDREP